MSDLKKYALHIHPLAALDIENAYEQLSVFGGAPYADSWQNDLRDVIAGLATLSERHKLAAENRLFQNQVFAFSYQFRKSRVIYRLFYSLHEPIEDAPCVHILHLRHAARKPMTRAEAREIEKDT